MVKQKPLIEAKSLFCERDDRVLFESLSFVIQTGEMVQIEGPNGSGKTTLLRILGGLSEAYEGDIYFNGEEIASVRAEYFSNLLYLGHKPGVKSVLSPMENLVSYMACRSARSSKDIETALSTVGLRGYEDVPCHSLSAGQHRRVALARLYLSDAPLWILDEAFTAIDKSGVKALENLMAQRVADGGTIILTTHHELFIKGGYRKITLGESA